MNSVGSVMPSLRPPAALAGWSVIEGPAGIGKSALMRAARRVGAQAGMEVLTARGLELEREFAFGVTRQLFEAELSRATPDRVHDALAGAAGLVRPLLGLSRRRDDQRGGVVSHPAPDLSFTLVHGFYWLTANLSEGAPLMVAIDDAHYADEASLHYIAYLAARCSELPVLLVVAMRSGDSSAVREVLTSLRSDPDAIVLSPEALSGDAVTELVRDRLGDAAATEFCTACARASAGNPFLLGELLAQLLAEGLAPETANATYVEGGESRFSRPCGAGTAGAVGG